MLDYLTLMPEKGPIIIYDDCGYLEKKKTESQAQAG